MSDPSSIPSTSGPIHVDGSEHDDPLSNSEYLTRPELLNRRLRRVKQLAKIYRDHYWVLMEELKLKHREYCLEHGKNPFVDDDNDDDDDHTETTNDNHNGNSRINAVTNGKCGVRNCKAKPMALTSFCRTHILYDGNQKLYVACSFPITKSSSVGAILCGNPTLRSVVPSYCTLHFRKAEVLMAGALRKVGLSVYSTRKFAPKFRIIVAEYVQQIQNKRRVARNVYSTRKLGPKFHIIVAEYVRQIQNKRRAARNANNS